MHISKSEKSNDIMVMDDGSKNFLTLKELFELIADEMGEDIPEHDIKKIFHDLSFQYSKSRIIVYDIENDEYLDFCECSNNEENQCLRCYAIMNPFDERFIVSN